MNPMAATSTNVLVAAGLLAVLVAAFIGLFLVPGVLHWRRLRGLLQRMARFDTRTPPPDFRKLFAGDRRLAHLWREYQDSLHVQTTDAPGQPVISGVRSTLPAETFFNGATVVDGRLHSEFFKHLPGLFTGIGIIGTFTGLIAGLRQFQVSENAASVRASLEALMHSVGEAFLISAAAIGAAMLVTLVEKLLLSALHAQAIRIAQTIDACFASAAGEDYLARLVKASEAAAKASPRLKDELVKELSDALGERLGGVIAASLEKSLKAPLQAMVDHLQAASTGPAALAAQTHRASAEGVLRLEAAIALFSERTQALLGGQAAGVDQFRQQSLQTQSEMRAVAAEMGLGLQGLTQATQASLEKINSGAERLARAGGDFADAGERVAAMMAQAAALSAKLAEATGTLDDGIAALQQGLAGHQQQREAIAQLVSELRGLLDTARKEATLSGEALARIESASQRLGMAQQQADQYLAGVNQVLGDAHQAFASAVRKTLEVGNAEFHSQLATAVGLLSATIHELDSALGNAVPPQKPGK